MKKLTKNFNFVTDKELSDKLLKIEDRFKSNDYDPIFTEARWIAEYILKEKYNFSGTLNEMIFMYKESYGNPIIVDALFHIKKLGNKTSHFTAGESNVDKDKIGVIYLIKSLSILCQDIYIESGEFTFTEMPYLGISIDRGNVVTPKTINDTELKITKNSLIDWFKQDHLIFNIPFYQRKYSWTYHNIDTLLNDIVDRVEDRHQHYFGVIATKKEIANSNQIKYKIIDGQQRLTTTLLMLRAAYDVILQNNYKEIKELTAIFGNNTMDSRYINESIPKGERKELSDILNGKFDKNSASWNYGKNYKYLFGKFHVAQWDRISDMVLTFISKFEIANLEYDVDASREMDIFENMNSKGTELHEWDLIKNQIFNQASRTGISNNRKVEILKESFTYNFTANMKPDRQDEELKKFITELVHLKSVTNEIDYREYKRFPVYNNFKTVFNKYKPSTEGEYESFIGEINKYGIIYKALYWKDISLISNTLIHLQTRLNNITQKNQPIFLIMFLFEKYFDWSENKWNINNNKGFERDIILLDTFLIRIEVISGFGHTLRTKFISVIQNMISGTTMKECLLSLDINVKDSLFIEKLNTDMKNNLATRILLQTDVFLLDQGSTGDFINIMKSPSLEHVMPQKDTHWRDYLIEQTSASEFQVEYDKHLNKIGNFYALPRKINASISNNVFNKKKDELLKYKSPLLAGDKKHNIIGLESIEEWSLEFIDKRTSALIDLIVKHVYKF